MSMGTVCVLLLLFYWVPFVVGAWFTDVYTPRRREGERRNLEQRGRPVGSYSPAVPAH
jgi:hypothetical protein